MKIIKPTVATTLDDSPDKRDAAFGPRKAFARTFVMQADGFHGFYQLSDGKTVGHAIIKTEDLIALFENADANFKTPAKSGGISSVYELNKNQ